MAKNLLDAVYGALIAGAIGDALGAPAENMYYDQIRKKHGQITDFIEYDNVAYSSGKAGAITDDTTLKHYLCLAIVRKGSRITPDDAARVWLEELNPERFWNPDKVAFLKMQAGVSPWDAGRHNIPSACATMAMTPIGIINAGNPAQAYQDGFNIAAMNGDGFNRDASATFAAGVAAAFLPDATVDSVLATMTQHASWLVKRAIVKTMHLVEQCDSTAEFTERFYHDMLDWWSRPGQQWQLDHVTTGTAIETVPICMALFKLCQGQVNACLLAGANFGRDADAISSLTGTLAGILHGASSLRADWIEKVEKANEPFFAEVEGDKTANFLSMAQRLVQAIEKEMLAAHQRADLLKQLLSRDTSTEKQP